MKLDSGQGHPTRARLGVLAFACSLSLITYLDRVCIARAQHDIQRDLGFSDAALGLVFSAFTLGYALFEVPAGYLGDTLGARAILTRIVLAWSLFTALTGCVWPFSLPLGWLLLDALGLMLLIRFLFGAGEAGAYPLLTRVVADWFPGRERGGALGAIWMFARLGGAMAPLVLGRLSALVGWRAAFWVLGGVGVLWAIAFRFWFRNRPEEHPGCNQAEQRLIREGKEDPPRCHGHAWPGWGVLLGNLSVILLCTSSFWLCFAWYFYPTWQPRYLADVFGFAPDGWLLEALTGAPFLCGAAGCLFGGRLTDLLCRGPLGMRWGRAVIALGGFAGAGGCVLAAGMASSLWLAVTLLCAAFLINDLAVPVMWATSGDLGGPSAGSLSGLMNSVGAVGAILLPVLIPYVLALLPGALAIASASASGPGAVWDAQTGEAMFHAPAARAEAGPVTSVALGRGSRLVAFGHEGGEILAYSLRGGDEDPVRIKGPGGAVHALSFKPHSGILLAGSARGMKAYDAESGEEAASFSGHKGGTLAVAWRHDGRQLASGGADGSVREWSYRTGEALRVLRGHVGPVRGVTYDPRGRRLFSCGDDGTVRVWKPDGQSMVLPGPGGPLLSISHSSEGGLVASAGRDGKVRLWRAEDGALVRDVEAGPGPVRSLSFSPTSAHLVTGGAGGEVVAWDQDTGARVVTLDGGGGGPVTCVMAALDSGRAAWRWRMIFAGLAGAWLLAALPWLLIDPTRPLGANHREGEARTEGSSGRSSRC
jgi:WD40 repeat protein/sugar phosphate permease